MPAPKTRRQYSGGSVQAVLTAHVAITDTQINGSDFSTWPEGTTGAILQPVAATINPGGSNEEKVFYSPRNGNTLQNCERGADGTVAQVHEAGEPIIHSYTAIDADESNSHIADDTTDDHSQYVHVSAPRTVTADHTFSGNPKFTGAPTFSGSPTFSQPAEFKGQTVFDDNPRFKGKPVFDLMSQQSPTVIGPSSSSVGSTGVPADAGHIHGVDVQALLALLMPAGTILDYGGTVAPQGFLFCDGSAVSRTLYPALYAAIATSFGVGDGVTTFNLPDLRGKFRSGTASGRVVGATGGSDTVTLDVTNLPTHHHAMDHGHPSVNDPGHAHNFGPGFEYVVASPNDEQNYIIGKAQIPPGVNNTNATYSNSPSSTTGISVPTSSGLQTADTGGGSAFSNLPSYVAVNQIIKAH